MTLVASLMGNSLVVFVTFRNRQLRKSINIFLLNLSIAHLVLSMFTVPFAIKRIYIQEEEWLVGGTLGSILCTFVAFAADISLIVSIFTLEVVAIERFSSIVLPLHRKQATTKKTCYIVIVVMWVIGAMYPSLNFFKYRIVYKDDQPYCIRSWEPIISNEKAFAVEAPMLLVLFTVLPFVLFSVLYTAIIISLHRQKRHLQLASTERKRREKENRQVTYMLATVVAIFLLSWTPFNVYWFLRAFVLNFDTKCELRHIRFSATFLMNIYPAVNPWLYFIFSRNYRNGLREVLHCVPLKDKLAPTRTTDTQAKRHSSGAVLLLSKRRSHFLREIGRAHV